MTKSANESPSRQFGNYAEYSPANTGSPRPERPHVAPEAVHVLRQQRELGDGEPCNYIITIGDTGSGKSTLQNHILRYLLTQREYVAEPDTDFAKQSRPYRKLVSEWNQLWRTGAFPAATPMSNPVEFRFKVTPLKPEYKGCGSIFFGFFELSGEDFRVLTEAREEPPELLPTLSDFLRKDKHSLAFLLICNGSDIKADDQLFSEFLNYLDQHIDRSFSGKCSAVLVLADPESCKRALAEELREAPPPDDAQLDVDGFVKYFTPQTYARLLLWGERAVIAPFSVGVIEHDPNKKIIKPSFNDARLIFDWLYQRFTNKKPRNPRGGLIRRGLVWLAELSALNK